VDPTRNRDKAQPSSSGAGVKLNREVAYRRESEPGDVVPKTFREVIKEEIKRRGYK
jgi:hypothetical protein